MLRIMTVSRARFINSCIYLSLVSIHRVGKRSKISMLRIMAAPGDRERSRLSVVAQNWTRANYEFTIPGGAFVPPPQVRLIYTYVHIYTYIFLCNLCSYNYFEMLNIIVDIFVYIKLLWHIAILTWMLDYNSPKSQAKVVLGIQPSMFYCDQKMTAWNDLVISF